jgi:tight adherence protein C
VPIAIVITFLVFLSVGAAVAYYGYRKYARPGRVFDQLGGNAALALPGIAEPTAPEGLSIRIFELIGEKVPADPADVNALRADLITAGYRSDNAVAVFNGIRIVVVLVLVFLALVFGGDLTSNRILRIALPIVAAVVGWLGSSMYLERLGTQRQERLRFALPDALDLLVVSVEAGLALDQAIQNVGRELATTHVDLSDELKLVNLEMRAGTRRSEALKHLAERTGEQEIRKLVAILIQTDRFGTSVAEALRTHSDFMRVRRRQEAEERAAKVGVKLVFPIFFFILPAMLLVTAGPGVLQIIKVLIPLMKQSNLG